MISSSLSLSLSRARCFLSEKRNERSSQHVVKSAGARGKKKFWRAFVGVVVVVSFLVDVSSEKKRLVIVYTQGKSDFYYSWTNSSFAFLFFLGDFLKTDTLNTRSYFFVYI